MVARLGTITCSKRRSGGGLGRSVSDTSRVCRRRFLCRLFGPATAGLGAIACVAVVGGVSAWGGGELGKKPGEYIGEILYERDLRSKLGF